VNDGGVWSRWIYTSLCFLGYFVPMRDCDFGSIGLLRGLGLSSKHGVVVKGAEYFDKLNHLKYIAFDKTGTLTTGQMRVNLIKPNRPQRVGVHGIPACRGIPFDSSDC
jgi:Cd2+/Zn2+-exporting ATPase